MYKRQLYDDPPALPWLGLDSFWTALGDHKGVVTKVLDPGDYIIDVNLYSGEDVGYKLTIKALWPPPPRPSGRGRHQQRSPAVAREVRRGESRIAIPVSYTHLDVYKRQCEADDGVERSA